MHDPPAAMQSVKKTGLPRTKDAICSVSITSTISHPCNATDPRPGSWSKRRNIGALCTRHTGSLFLETCDGRHSELLTTHPSWYHVLCTRQQGRCPHPLSHKSHWARAQACAQTLPKAPAHHVGRCLHARNNAHGTTSSALLPFFPTLFSFTPQKRQRSAVLPEPVLLRVRCLHEPPPLSWRACGTSLSLLLHAWWRTPAATASGTLEHHHQYYSSGSPSSVASCAS